ncbi:hypothetical protein D1007_10048 [Hordeum vulgare]|nr:hypothetical protein D1007_10048 [Hordeum vulgare]
MYTGARPHAHAVAFAVSVTTSTSWHDGGGGGLAHSARYGGMKDSMTTHDECQWPGLDRAMALSAVDDVAIPEPMEEAEVAAFPPELVGAPWGWSCIVPEMAQAVGAVNWCPTPPRSPK